MAEWWLGRIPAAECNLGKLLTYVFMSPSSIIWYQPMGGDDRQLGRSPRAWRKVMSAYHRVCGLGQPAGDRSHKPGFATSQTRLQASVTCRMAAEDQD